VVLTAFGATNDAPGSACHLGSVGGVVDDLKYPSTFSLIRSRQM
jgi:hypothetical protein